MEDRQKYYIQSFQTLHIQPPQDFFTNFESQSSFFDKILQRIFQDSSSRQDLLEHSNTLSQNLRQAQSKIQHLQDQKCDLKNEIGRLQNQLAMNTQKQNAQVAKLKQQKQDLRKELSKGASKEVQYQHQIKKLEIQYKKLQDTLQKKTFGREVCQNSIETTFCFHSSKLTIDGFQQFLSLNERNYQHRIKCLQEQNQLIHQQLSQCLDLMESCLPQGKWSCQDFQQKIKSFQTVAEDLSQTRMNGQLQDYSFSDMKNLLEMYRKTISHQEKLITTLRVFNN